ncbi:MAG: GC-type dockerin domain-anchored protein [Phycisphaerales bacterium]|nr:GC-type dockerin domain-anchored protein [Phycisphaerales bacterium]
MNPSPALVAILMCAHAAVAQNIVVNGGFESPVVTTGWAQRLPGAVFGSWTVDSTGQGVAHVGSFGNPFAVEGLQSVELNFYQACGISQVVPTTGGGHYRLAFFLAGQLNAGPDVKHMRIDWDGAEVATVTWDRAAAGGAWEPHAFNLTASGPFTTLHFFGIENVDGGPYLDAVSLVPVCSAADLGSTGGIHQSDGVLDNNDFIAFIDYFFAGDPIADMGRQGGIGPGDGVFNNNDFIVFIDRFFGGCG